MHTAPKQLPELDHDLLLMMAGIERPDRWLQVALSVARNHREYAKAIEQQASRKFSGYQLEKVHREFEALHNEAGLARLFKESVDAQKAKNQTLSSEIKVDANKKQFFNTAPLAKTIIKIAEKMAVNTPVEECPPINTIAGDPELARLAVALHQAPQFRLWLVLLQMIRETNVNHLSRAGLKAALSKYKINVSERNLRRWLRRGHGIFWNVTDDYIYFAGYETVAKRLVEMALKHELTDLINTNRPGKRGMYIDVSGSLQQFEAHIYAAWLAHRENPTIARSTLSVLFNREARILRKWDKLAGIKVITNEAQFAPDHFPDVPEHAYMYEAAVGVGRSETRFRARMANTYHTPVIKQHGKRGQSRRVYYAVGKYLESVEPAGNCEQSEGSNALTGGLKPTSRRYFANAAKARSSAKHTGKRIRYIALRRDMYKRMVWDYAPDGVQRTTVGEELPLLTQKIFRPQRVYASSPSRR